MLTHFGVNNLMACCGLRAPVVMDERGLVGEQRAAGGHCTSES